MTIPAGIRYESRVAMLYRKGIILATEQGIEASGHQGIKRKKPQERKQQVAVGSRGRLPYGESGGRRDDRGRLI